MQQKKGVNTNEEMVSLWSYVLFTCGGGTNYIPVGRDVPRAQGGDTQIFFVYVGSDPASTVHPPKNQEFQAPQKIFEILATPKNIPILYLDLKKDPKMHRNGPQTSPILWWPKKYPQNLHTPKKYSSFSKPPKILKFRILNPPKNSPSLRMCENIRVPP